MTRTCGRPQTSQLHLYPLTLPKVNELVDFTVSRFGCLDVMVSNAGIVRAAPFLEMTEQDFDDVIRVNLKGVFLTGQAAARQVCAC